MMILECWPKALVEYCLQDEHWCEARDNEGRIIIEEKFARNIFVRLMKYVLATGRESRPYLAMMPVYQVVKLLYSNYYSGSYPSASNIERIARILRTGREYPLLDSLKVGLGGLQYVLNGVNTKLGQHLGACVMLRSMNTRTLYNSNFNFSDYLIVKRKTGELHAINTAQTTDDSDISYESLALPEDSFP